MIANGIRKPGADFEEQSRAIDASEGADGMRKATSTREVFHDASFVVEERFDFFERGRATVLVKGARLAQHDAFAAELLDGLEVLSQVLRTGTRDVRNNVDERMGMKTLREKGQTSFKVARERRGIEDTVAYFLPSVGNNWIAEVFGHHDALTIAKAFPACKQFSIQLYVCRQAS